MTAQEAREQTRKVILENSKKEVECVYRAINVAISKGEYSCFYYSSLSHLALEELKKDGYGVISTEIEGAYAIKWSEPSLIDSFVEYE